MKTIVVSSTNPVKMNAIERAFQRMFPHEDWEIKSVSVASGVSNQPFSSDETLQGALHRVEESQKHIPSADYWVGIEAGVEERNNTIEAFAWIVVQSPTYKSTSRTGTFPLPHEIATLLREGKELGEADDVVFRRSGSKLKNGAVGLLTANIIDRTSYYEHAVILALIPFKNTEFYR